MATFTGTGLNEFIEPGHVSASVIKKGASSPTPGADTINAGGGNDIVAGGDGADTVALGSGNDRFIWTRTAGNDTLDGGFGFDTLTVRGSAGSDFLGLSFDNGRAHILDGAFTSTPGDEISFNRIERLEFKPLGFPSEIILGQLAETGVKQVSINLAKTIGGTQSDGVTEGVAITGEDSAEKVLVTRVGTAVLVTGFGAPVTISHADAKDRLDLKGLGGNDRIDASALPAGVITLDIFGQDGNDTLIGSRGKDDLNGGADNDLLIGGRGADFINGSEGIDTASYAGSVAGVAVHLATGLGKGGDAQGDRLINIENLTGSRHNDVLDGDGNANTLNGGKGNDVLIGRGGADKLIGGGGIDTVNYAASAGGIGVALAFHFGSGGDATGDQLFGIENVIGSAFEDEIGGNGIANRLSGGKGDDLLAGRGGRDILTGGAGADHFLFDVNPDGSNNIVRIIDFAHAIDKIELEPVNFQALGLAFTPDEFRIGAAAKDASDRIIYNPVTGALIYDSNGSAPGHAVEFALLAPHLGLTPSDFDLLVV